MFTGLIEEIGIVKSINVSSSGIYMTITSNVVLEGTKIGDSITINGACQTVTDFGKDSFTVFASKVTCDVTTLGSLKVSSRVNLERAMSPGSRFGGHIVQGHVDGKGNLKSITKDENGIRIEISVPDETMRYIVEKGSVTVDGISLTVVSLIHGGFIIYIIPETIKSATLSEKKQGDEVNIEVDILAKYVEKMLGNKNVDRDSNFKKKLFEEGFM